MTAWLAVVGIYVAGVVIGVWWCRSIRRPNYGSFGYYRPLPRTRGLVVVTWPVGLVVAGIRWCIVEGLPWIGGRR